MTDARERSKSMDYLSEPGDDRISGLLAAAVNFADGKLGYLIPLKGEALLPGIAYRRCGQPAAEPLLGAELAPHEMLAISRAQTMHRASPDEVSVRDATSNTFAIADSSSNVLIVIATAESMSFVLYIERDQADETFLPQTIEALKLFSLALSAVLRNQAHGHSRTAFGVRETSVSHLQSEPLSKNKLLQNLDPCFLSGVAESVAIEVNDPLSAVVAHASAGLEWLSQDPPKVEKARSSLRKIAAAAFAAGRVISTYRSVADPSRLGLQHAELNDVVGRALDVMSKEMQANEIICRCDFSGKTEVFVVPTQIEQALVNLASVAMDEMKNIEGPRELRVTTVLQGSHVLLSLSDTSSGIQPDAHDAFFDPTYTQKEGGRGIKLAIARTIAQLHGGSLDIARSDAAGTTMCLRLPATRPS